jgi:hypothetical protein
VGGLEPRFPPHRPFEEQPVTTRRPRRSPGRSDRPWYQSGVRPPTCPKPTAHSKGVAGLRRFQPVEGGPAPSIDQESSGALRKLLGIDDFSQSRRTRVWRAFLERAGAANLGHTGLLRRQQRRWPAAVQSVHVSMSGRFTPPLTESTGTMSHSLGRASPFGAGIVRIPARTSCGEEQSLIAAAEEFTQVCTACRSVTAGVGRKR